ncbi:MAG: hypothetical protein ACR2PW_00595, partial [Gammaproteobacteria bacterium]
IQKAAEHGFSTAQYNLALKYYHGRGVEKNLSLGYMWYILAAANGDEAARIAVQKIEQEITPLSVEFGHKLADRCARQNYMNCNKL